MKHALLAAFAVLAFGALPANAAQDWRAVTVAVPKTAAASAAEMPILHVTLGELPRGTTILVEREDGTLLGSVSPFGIVPGHAAGTYSVPLHASDIVAGKVTVHLAVSLSRNRTRAPSTAEVPSVSVVFAPAAK